MARTKTWDSHTPEGGAFGNGFPVLKATHALFKKKNAIVVGTLTGDVTHYESEFGDGFMFGVKIGSETFDLRAKSGSGNEGRLKALAPKAKDTRGTKIRLGVKSFKDNAYVAVLD
jgi:hypothetical protein